MATADPTLEETLTSPPEVGADAPEVPVHPVELWRAQPTPANLSAAVDSLQGRLNYHLHRYGLGSDPLAEAHARGLAAKALQSYDPAAGASLVTWLDRSMQPLTRFKRLRATAIKVPEKIQLDSLKIDRAQRDFEDEHGREPELDELADHVGMTVKRVHQVRRSFKKMSGEGAFEGNLAGQHNDTDHTDEALDAIWHESDKIDRKILEMRIGYGGKPITAQPKDIATNLGISPVELSRRSSRIAAKLDELLEGLER